MILLFYRPHIPHLVLRCISTVLKVMKVVHGDLLKLAVSGRFDVIVHGCNCYHAMGAGIARSIRLKFPAAYEADKATEYGSRAKLGTFSSAAVKTGELEDHPLTVVNAYTQHHYARASDDGVLADYTAIRAAFGRIKTTFPGKRIGYPRIGAGLAGGDWGTIRAIIEDELGDEDHTLVEYKP